MEKMNDFWSLNEATFYCLYDKKRSLSFRKAIRNTVKKGDVVLELGAGSGILSMFAADAGAKKVYAVELDSTNYNTLVESISLNNYDDKIIPIRDDALSVKIPEKVDVIICEMIATGLIEELQLPAMNNALQHAHSKTKVILQKYDILLDLVEMKSEYYNKKFYINRFEFPDKTSLRSKPKSQKYNIKQVNFSKINRSNKVNETLSIKICRDGVINGLRLSSLTTFSDNSTLNHSLAYSFPIILPIEEQVVKIGDFFTIKISYKMCEGPESLRYSIKKV